MEQISIVPFSPAQHGHLIPAIIQMHIDCIEFDGALLRFHPPFNPEKRQKMESFWRERFAQIPTGRRITLLALASPDGKEEGDVAGIIELGMPEADTGPFRGDVELLMVSPKYRRRGLANRLIHDLEEIAREKKRTLLVSEISATRRCAEYLHGHSNWGQTLALQLKNMYILAWDISLYDLLHLSFSFAFDPCTHFIFTDWNRPQLWHLAAGWLFEGRRILLQTVDTVYQIRFT